MNLFDVYPVADIVIEKGQGSFIWDNKGNRYLDLYGGHAVISVGHSHPHYVSMLSAQLNKIGFYSNSVKIPQQQELAAKLGEVSGKPDYQLFLCNSGAEANENAIKLASFHNGRSKVIAFTKGFHGRTSLAVAATDNPAIVAPVNRTDNVIFLPFNDTDALTACFDKQGDEVAAVIVESIQGVGGINVADDDFLRTIRSLCNKYGAVCIADEVQCGYGRTGSFFAFDHCGERADIYTMAKGMGNGFPVGGIAITPAIKARYGLLGTTFGGNYLACAAAVAVLDVMTSERLMDMANETGKYLMGELAKLPAVSHVRGRGLMIGFEMEEPFKGMRNELLYKHFIFTGEAKPHVVRLLPALNLKKQEADILLDAVRSVTQKSN